jgi:hypothetical protein
MKDFNKQNDGKVATAIMFVGVVLFMIAFYDWLKPDWTYFVAKLNNLF